MSLHADLAFLRPFIEQPQFRYRSPPWLENCHWDSTEWHIDSGHRFSIDWRVRLADDALLTAPKHREFWTVLRAWLVLQSHPDLAGAIPSPRTTYNAIRSVLGLCDYFVLNSSTLGILSHGFGAVTSNDLRALAIKVSSARLHEAVYDWPNRLAEFLRGRSPVARNWDEAARRLLEQPIPSDRLTDLSDQEVFHARAYLWKTGAYDRAASGGRRPILKPNTRYLQSRIFPGGLLATPSMPIAPELALPLGLPLRREKAAAPVRRNNSGALTNVTALKRSISGLCLLANDSLPVPRSATAMDDITGAAKGRFATLPPAVVFGALEAALTYVIEHGDHLVTSYQQAVRECCKSGTTLIELSKTPSFAANMSPATLAFGVTAWSARPNRPATSIQPGETLRANAGLYESLRVLYGAVQVVVGALTARREGELMDLVAGDALDESRTWIRFRNRKSGPGGYRQLEERASPRACSIAISCLERIHFCLRDLGLASKNSHLFAFPRRNGAPALIGTLATNMDESLDYFCDWAALPADDYGRRYYIRHHQLRRFFAMSFFWQQGFARLDTLRHYLGHGNVEHVYHYITEATPGAVLVGVKAQYLLEAVKRGEEGPDLAELLERRYHTSTYHLLPSDDLEEYVTSLLESGQVKVEPVFLDHGRKYTVIVNVERSATSHEKA